MVSKLKSMMQEVKWELSSTAGEEQGRSKLIASDKYLDSRIFEMCNDGGIGMSEASNTWEWKSLIK